LKNPKFEPKLVEIFLFPRIKIHLVLPKRHSDDYNERTEFMAHTATFQYPDHFNPQRELDAYNQGYYPIYGAEPYGRDQQILGYNDRLVIAGKQWGMDHNYSSAITADPKNGNALIIVDGNGDFVIPNGALAVPGAMGDMDRVVRWIYQNLGRIDHIVASMDAHYPIQIFHPAFWIDRKTGQMPASR
jgi:hypothetical protein